jgi:hypothetical protein
MVGASGASKNLQHPPTQAMFALTTHQPLSLFPVLPARGQEDVRACVDKLGKLGDCDGGKSLGKNDAFYSLQLHTEAKT